MYPTMNRKIALLTFLIIILAASCTVFEEENSNKIQTTNIIPNDVKSIIINAQSDYSKKFGSYCSYKDLFSDVSWDSCKIIINNTDTTIITFPINNERVLESWYLVVDKEFDSIKYTVLQIPKFLNKKKYTNQAFLFCQNQIVENMLNSILL